MIDLHIHTTATPHHSSWSPEQLAAAAAARGLTAIAAVDHNTTASVGALQAAGARHGIQVISGVEIDSAFGGKLWHSLIYGAEPDAPALLELCAAVFERNAADAQRLIAGLPSEGFVLAGLDTLGRRPNVADVATALAAQNELPGRVAGEGDEEAGMRYLLRQRPGSYNPIDVSEIIATAHSLGALAVLAHPGRSKGIYAIPADAEDIAAMAAAGLDGIEVYYPSHSPAQRAFLLEQARIHGLRVSGGSDSHHPHQELARSTANS
ncbi:MAG: PHP domain-containing protein, partial [Oscillochloris sp.]|nr:PHP domain-containing protein [Oscillochloris sp.]